MARWTRESVLMCVIVVKRKKINYFQFVCYLKHYVTFLFESSALCGGSREWDKPRTASNLVQSKFNFRGAPHAEDGVKKALLLFKTARSAALSPVVCGRTWQDFWCSISPPASSSFGKCHNFFSSFYPFLVYVKAFAIFYHYLSRACGVCANVLRLCHNSSRFHWARGLRFIIIIFRDIWSLRENFEFVVDLLIRCRCCLPVFLLIYVRDAGLLRKSSTLFFLFFPFFYSWIMIFVRVNLVFGWLG